MEYWTEDIVDKLINATKIPLEMLVDTDSNLDCFYDGIVKRCYETVFIDRDLEMCIDENILGCHCFFLINEKCEYEAYVVFCYINDKLFYFSPEDCSLSMYDIVTRFLFEANERYDAVKIERIDCRAYTLDYLEKFKGNSNDRQYINSENDERFVEVISKPTAPVGKDLYICYPVPKDLGLSLEENVWEEML